MVSFALVEEFGQIKHRKTVHPPFLRGSHHTNNGCDHHQDWAGIVTLLVRDTPQSKVPHQGTYKGGSLERITPVVDLFVSDETITLQCIDKVIPGLSLHH